MSGISSHAVRHLVRRGVQAVTNPDDLYIQQLNEQAELYENAFTEHGSSSHVDMWEIMLPVVTWLAISILYASVEYTLGAVIATLAMIEQPATFVMSSEPKQSLDGSDPDAPLEKAALLDEEVVVLKEQPVTSSIRKSIQHLHQIGGFQARWRGLGASIVYHMAHVIATNLFTTLFTMSLTSAAGFAVGQIAASMLASIVLCRLHMTWTHVMISKPSPLPWFKRIPGGRQVFKTLLLPSAVFALAQHATIIFPIALFYTGGAREYVAGEELVMALRVLMALANVLLVTILFLLPASVTLTRIEASMLPEDQETIVSFDRTLNGAATSAITLGAASSKSIFVEAWKSFDAKARVRLMKFYAKMAMILSYIIISGGVLVAGEIILMGPERLFTFIQAAHAQLVLIAMGQ